MTNADHPFPTDVVVIGGCGHVGLPLAIALADRGLSTVCYDVSDAAVKLVNDAVLPFEEPGAAPVLDRVIASGALRATTDPAVVAVAEHLVVVIGTPVDEHLNPDPQAIPRALDLCSQYFRDGQLLVLRSTVYPGVTDLVERMIARLGVDVDVAFCPERIAEGHAMEELFTLPQIVGARTDIGRDRASALFSRLTDQLVHLNPEEAELAKLFTNTWRYIRFATANQLYMIANDSGLDYERIREALSRDYPRAADLPARASPPARACSRTRCSSRRSTTTTSASATRRCWSTRACPSTWCRAWSSGSTCATWSSGSWAWPSRRAATTPARACRTS